MSNSRRGFLQGAVLTPLPFLVPRVRSVVLPLKARPLPEFWFGERVTFCWNDEDTEQPHSETGEIVGVTYDPREGKWEYAVIWLSSTTYPSERYPLFDGTFFTGDELCKL